MKKRLLLIGSVLVSLLIIGAFAYHAYVQVPYKQHIDYYKSVNTAGINLEKEFFLYDDFRKRISKDPETWPQETRTSNQAFNQRIAALELEWLSAIKIYNVTTQSMSETVLFLGDMERTVLRKYPIKRKIDDVSLNEERIILEGIFGPGKVHGLSVKNGKVAIY